MFEVGDNIEYSFLIKNDSNENYKIDKTNFNINSNYINYSLETNDNSNIVKANSSKNVILRVKYKTKVPEGKFNNGSYNDNKDIVFQLSSDSTINVFDIINNPKTGVQFYFFILVIVLLVCESLNVFFKKKKYTRLMILVIGVLIIIPISVYATCNYNIIINSFVKINGPIECGSFSDDDWDVISYNIKNNNDTCYNVGDKKIIDMGELGTHVLRISNKSVPSSCNTEGFSQTACGFVLEFEDVISLYKMKPNLSTKDGWPSSSMRTYLNNDIYDSLPVKLKNVIIDTTVVSGYNIYSTEPSLANYISIDKIYLLDAKELYGESFENVNNTARDSERQLDYYLSQGVTNSNYSNVSKKYNGNKYSWWLRSIYNNDTFYFVDPHGRWDWYNHANRDDGVSPAFRIG